MPASPGDGKQGLARRHQTIRGIGREISPIGLGTWQFSEGRGGARGHWAPVSREETGSVVQAALDGGINWFDTAELYGFGRSETGLARALVRSGVKNGEVVIATKWHPFFRFAGSIRSTIGRRLECLNPYGIDLHQVHFPASFSSIPAQMNAMADLVAAGKIRAVGVSNFSARQMRLAHEALAKRGLVLGSNQVKYSLLDRRIEDNGILQAARELGVTVIAYSPLEMGLLSGKFHKDPAVLGSRPLIRRLRLGRILDKSRNLVLALERIAAAHGASAAQVALNWVTGAHGETVVAIPGASTAEQARECAGAMNITLSPEEMAEIDGLSRRCAAKG